MFDLDGTLLVDHQDLRPRVVTALQEAHRRGVILVVSSGRPIGMVPDSLRNLGIMDYYVCTNGATLFDANFAKVRDVGMRPEVARGIVWALDPLNPRWSAFVDGRGFIEARCATYMLASGGGVSAGGRSWRSLARRGVRLLLGLDNFRQVGSIRPVVARATSVEKLGCVFANAEDTYNATRLLTDAGLEVAIMGSRELELTAPGVTKGSGAAWLIAHLGIDSARTVAFGDGGNDASLVSVVGTFVAMGNADATLKAVATCTCGDVADDGVATWLEAQMAETARM